MRISFIVKGLIKNKDRLFGEIRNFFPGAEIFETTHSFHAVELARNAVVNASSHIISVGGDGSLSEVVNGIMLSGDKNLPVIGLLPYGTANDFSKSVNLNDGLKQLRELVDRKTTRKIDVGSVFFTDRNGKAAERYFVNIGDIGIGGFIVENINKSSKMLGANMTFFLETLKAMFTYQRTKVKCVCKEFSWEGKTLSMVMANGKYFGSGLCIAPDAALDDGKLNIVILGDVTVIDYLKNISRLKRGEKIIHPEVFYRETDEIEITPLESKCPIDLDGEFIGYAPAKFKILPAKIDFLMG